MGNDIKPIAISGSATKPAIARITTEPGQNSASQESTGTQKLLNNSRGLFEFVTQHNDASNAVKYVNDNSPWNLTKAISAKSDTNNRSQAITNNNSLNPTTNPNFDDFKNYGRKELENYYGDLDAIKDRISGGGGDGVPEAVHHAFKENSEFAKTLQKNGVSQTDTKNIWDRTSEINGYLFQEGTDKFAKAMDSTSEKFFQAGHGNLLTDVKNTVHDNAEVLSHAMKNNMSVDGIKQFSGIYKAYLEGRDNVANAGVVDRAGYEHFMRTGELTTSRNYGDLQLSEAEMKGLGNAINQNTFNKVLTAAGFDANQISDHLKQNNGVQAKNNFDGTYFAAMGLTSMAAEKNAEGKTGFNQLVADARIRDGNPQADYNAVGHISFMNNSVDMNTDGTAFTRGEKGLIGLDGVTTFGGGGLRNNPLNPNVLVHGIQGSAGKDDFARIDSEMQAAKEAGIKYRALNFDVSGHGSRESDGSAGVMMKSGIVSDKNQFDFQDAERAANLLVKNIENGGTVNITADACEAAPLAKRIGELTQQQAKAAGLDIKINFQGSKEFGLASSHQMGEKANGDTRAVMNEDGMVNFFRFRGDHNDGDTNILKGTLYSRGEGSFKETAAKYREENWNQSTSSPAEQAKPTEQPKAAEQPKEDLVVQEDQKRKEQESLLNIA